jgi:peptide/nickel transport system permease protein
VSWLNLIRRLSSGVVSALLASALIFVATALLPGDAATTILGENATPESLQVIRDQLGLGRPIYVQYFRWLGGVLTGNFGTSATLGQPVTTLLAQSLGHSLILAASALIVAIVVSVPLGTWAAAKQGSRSDGTILTISYIGVAIPDFVTGPLLMMIFAGAPLFLLPSNGYVRPSESIAGFFSHLVLPTLTLVSHLVAHLVRQTRAGMVEVLASDYVRTARLKGLSEGKVLRRHVLPNSLTATIAVIALDVGYLLGSIVIVEEIFAFPGIGRLTIYAVSNRDIPLIQGTTLVIALAYILANIVGDLLQRLLNPKVADE